MALLVDPGDAAISAAIAAAKPDFLQLHGAEAPARVGEIRAKFGLPVIKALPVAEIADLAVVPMYEQAADMLLFDAKAPRGAAGRAAMARPSTGSCWPAAGSRSPGFWPVASMPENVARAIGRRRRRGWMCRAASKARRASRMRR